MTSALTAIEPQSPRSLIGLSRDELTAEIANIGAAPFRARQLWHWIYHRGARDFSEMTSLAKDFRHELSAHFTIARPAESRAQISLDGLQPLLQSMRRRGQGRSFALPMVDRQHFQRVFGVGAAPNRFCAIHVAGVYADFPPLPRCHPRRSPLARLIDFAVRNPG